VNPVRQNTDKSQSKKVAGARCLCLLGQGGLGLYGCLVPSLSRWPSGKMAVEEDRAWSRVAIHSIHSTHHFGGMEMDASEISSVEWINLKVKLNGLTLNGQIEAIIHTP